MTRFRACAIALLFLAPAATAGGQSMSQRIEQRVQTMLDTLNRVARFPGMTVGVALPDGTTLGLATGMADSIAKQPMTRQSRMLQGSVGKTYFAATALQLVREGRLNLDDRISKFFASESWWKTADGKTRLPNGDSITVRQLMNHTSGLVRYEFKPEFQAELVKTPLRTWTAPDRLAFVLDAQPPFAAGQGWQYSDTNYIVLGMIIEKVVNNSAYDEIKRRFLDRHQLRNTIPSDRIELPNVVQGYAGANNPFGGSDAMIVNGRFVVNPQLEWAGGGFASTAEDLAKWARLLYTTVLDSAILATATTGVAAQGLGQGAKYGLGVIIRDTPIGLSWGHSGFFPGYLTEMRYYPQHKFSVALQVNTSSNIGRNPGVLLQNVAAVIAEELAKGN